MARLPNRLDRQLEQAKHRLSRRAMKAWREGRLHEELEAMYAKAETVFRAVFEHARWDPPRPKAAGRRHTAKATARAPREASNRHPAGRRKAASPRTGPRKRR